MDNIILLTYDSLRADHCGHHGYHRDTTPNLDNLAEDGIEFENAISVASRTNPSMAGTFTGEPMAFREPVSSPEVAKYHLKRYGTIAEKLSELGYSTGAFCPNAYASRYYGFDRGFDRFEDFLFTEDKYQSIFEQHLEETGIYSTLRNFRNFVKREEVFQTWDRYIEYIEEWAKNEDGPYFLWVFSLDTHFPFLTPKAHREYSNVIDQYYYNWKSNQIIDETAPEVTEKTWKKIKNIYDDSIRYADKLIPELRSRLSDDDPTIIAHSDHGEAFGEHGMFGHFYPSMYEENMHVPVVAWKSDVESQTISQPFSLLDIPQYIIQTAVQGDLTDPPTRNAAIMSDYDGRRNRNLIAARSKSSKVILEEENSSSTYKTYNIQQESDPKEVEIKQENEDLRELINYRKNHEEEVINIRRRISSLSKI